MTQGLSLKDFLNHQGNTRGNSTFLKGWKNRPSKSVDTWLALKANFRPLWRHGFPKLVELTDKTTQIKTVQVFQGQLNCWEPELALKQQYRFDSSGYRLIPPTACPLCKLTDWLRLSVLSGELSWTTPVFRFQGSDTSKTAILHAGGLYNAFSGKLDDEERAELVNARIFQRDAWKENCQARLNYVMVVADNDNLSSGLQVSIEGGLLGDKVKEAIRDRMLSKGDTHGDPMVHPFCLRWLYLPNEQEFSKKYKVVAMDTIPCRREVQDVISQEPPNLDQVTNPFNTVALRAQMERHALVDFPWDRFFPPSPEQKAQPSRTPEVSTAPVQQVPTDSELCKCETCSGVMKMSDPKCPHCGETYEVQAEPPPPPPPPLPTRTRPKPVMLAQQASPLVSAVVSALPKKMEPVKSVHEEAADNAFDDVPF